MNYRKYRCEHHLELYKANKYKTKTIGEYRNMISVKGKHASWLHSHVRNFARSWLKHLTKLPCKFCGYKEHVELAHIKGVSEFNDKELLSVVNSEKNVIQLCPNCHWEFDNKDRKLFTHLLN
jgi:predicted restriction endonuclease